MATGKVTDTTKTSNKPSQENEFRKRMKGGRGVGPVSRYTRDLFHQHCRKGKIVMTKISRYKGLVLCFWHLKLI